MISKYYGKYYSLAYLIDLCGNTREGVSLAGLSYGAESVGAQDIGCALQL
nr:cysteine peptidase family C39 domain-containing protein [uncultured Sphingobacterium sp.]